MPGPYSDEFLFAVDRTVTQERLKRYRAATNGSLPKALELYEINVQLSSLLFGLLHGIEVSLRNAEHLALSKSYGTEFWYEAPQCPEFGMPGERCEGPQWHAYAPLTEYWKDKVTAAKKKAGLGKNPGKVIAELSFGFWVDLLRKQNNMPLWVGRKLNLAFPHTKHTRGEIHERMKEIQQLRNRIAHHQRIVSWSGSVYNGCKYLKLDEIVESVDWICPHTAHWIRQEFHFAEASELLARIQRMGVRLQ